MRVKLLMLTTILASFILIPAPSRAITTGETCYGVTAANPALPLRSDAIESVSPVYRNTRTGRYLGGVAITYRPGLDLSASQMQETLDCQIASGLQHPSADSPLTVKNIKANALARGDRLHVAITADDAASADKVLKRTRRLAEKP